MSEAEVELDEIDAMIRRHRWLLGKWWETEKSTDCKEYAEAEEARQKMLNRIQSIITERDQLRKAMQSHRDQQFKAVQKDSQCKRA